MGHEGLYQAKAGQEALQGSLHDMSRPAWHRAHHPCTELLLQPR